MASSDQNEPPIEFEFSDPEVLRACLQMIADECTKDVERRTIEMLLKLCRNIMLHPGEEKYLKIRKENKAIHDKLLCYDGAKEFLLAIGWTEIDDSYMFLQEPDLSVAISILDEQLNTLPPPQTTSPSSSGSSNIVQSPQNQHSVWTDEELQKREKQLEEDRKKRLEEYKRMKKAKEEIKKQIMEDRKDSNTREVHASHARHLDSGTFKKFENKGGGG